MKKFIEGKAYNIRKNGVIIGTILCKETHKPERAKFEGSRSTVLHYSSGGLVDGLRRPPSELYYVALVQNPSHPCDYGVVRAWDFAE